MQLVAENLVLSRGGRTLIDGLSFALTGGETLLLTGPNGAGKTTLLRALAGFFAPASGRVHLANAGDEREESELLHFVGHLDGIKTHLTVAENLAFWADYLDGRRERDRAERIGPALKQFGLEGLSDIPAGYLSAGQKRRLALCRLNVAERPLWLLDEPTVSLDADAVSRLVAAIDVHVAGGGIAVIATHAALAIAGARAIRLGAAAERAA